VNPDAGPGRRPYRVAAKPTDGNEGVMKVLVTAASKHGATAEIAAAIGEVLRDAHVDAAVVPPRRSPPSIATMP
jgi:hypothetical protein